MKHILTLCITLLATFTQAVEVGPYKVTKVVDGDTIEVQTNLGPQRVRMLYIDTPESSGNSHGKAMPEGVIASDFLKTFLKDKQVKLWGPGDTLQKDNYGRTLADPLVEGSKLEGNKQVDVWLHMSDALIGLGHTPYWRKYGEAPEPLHSTLLKSHQLAREQNKGAWASAPQYMIDKTNERTAPKDETKVAIKKLDSAVIIELYKAELEKDPTHTHWLNGEKRHNKECQYFGVTKEGAFCTKDDGVACGKCGG